MSMFYLQCQAVCFLGEIPHLTMVTGTCRIRPACVWVSVPRISGAPLPFPDDKRQSSGKRTSSSHGTVQLLFFPEARRQFCRTPACCRTKKKVQVQFFYILDSTLVCFDFFKHLCTFIFKALFTLVFANLIHGTFITYTIAVTISRKKIHYYVSIIFLSIQVFETLHVDQVSVLQTLFANKFPLNRANLTCIQRSGKISTAGLSKFTKYVGACKMLQN